jgi:hypothetical protein
MGRNLRAAPADVSEAVLDIKKRSDSFAHVRDADM